MPLKKAQIPNAQKPLKTVEELGWTPFGRIETVNGLHLGKTADEFQVYGKSPG